MQSRQSGKLREKSSVLSRHLKVDKELDERTSGDRVFQTRAATIGKARSPTVDSDVGTANVSDDHDRSRCLDGRSLMLCIRWSIVCSPHLRIFYFVLYKCIRYYYYYYYYNYY